MGAPLRIIEKHSALLRFTHWLNFILLSLMTWSGILIYWANDVYPGFFPEWFYRLFHIDHRLAEGMAVHFTIAWLFVANSVVYALYVGLSSHWRELFPDRQAFRNLVPTVLHDLGLRAEAPPQGKFNAAQRIVYTGIGVLGLLEVLSGLAIYKPVQLRPLTLIFGDYEGARLVHFIGMVSFCAFFVLHVIQVIRAGWNNFRSMVAGFELEE